MAEKKDRAKTALGKSASVRSKPPVKPSGATKSNVLDSQPPKTVRGKAVDSQNGKADMGSSGKQNWNKLVTSSKYVVMCRYIYLMCCTVLRELPINQMHMLRNCARL